MNTLNIKNPIGPDYDILIGKDFSGLGNAIDAVGFNDLKNRKVCIITDSNVGPLYAEAVKGELLKVAGRVDIFTFPAGEEHKHLDTVKEAYRFLIEHHYDRKDVLAALGGGVTGDMCGYVSATYLRGVDFIQIPTSLLAQVDSSIGGKTGVDFDSYKNMVGAFHMPRLVYMNVSVLNTLPEREFSCGMAEIIKHGLIKDKDYFRWIIDRKSLIMSLDSDTLSELIYKSCCIKGAVVEEDPKEQGIRAHLNFGHTLGHALEKYMDLRLLHGECVAFGCVAAAHIACERGLLSEDEVGSIKDAFTSCNLPVSFSDVFNIAGTSRNIEASISAITDLTRSDKKADAGKVRFVLLQAIGDSFTDRSVTEEEMRSALLKM